MINIWSFLLQTVSVTVVAGLLLLIKSLLEDKLSPRWQYGIWSILAIRILLPVQSGKYFIFPVSVWLETLKGLVEKHVDSSYSQIYFPVRIKHVVPVLEGGPESFTDWLFVLYVTGVAATVLWYFVSYIRLRILLKHAEIPSVKLQNQIQYVGKKYGLKICKPVVIRGLPSAFVCSGVTPILAIPKEIEIDDKVILHELLHLKYHDELQSMFWCLLRCLHWCNPFLQYVFNRIENDMESLCDQRVLERLEGEERRAYGMILLNMVNEKYARVPGTSSISNGGKNIKRRIAAIVRFKKYPKGMGLVSVCVGIMLIVPVLNGIAYEYDEEDYWPETSEGLHSAMALARVNRPTTLAGALDAYAKGLIYENGIYIASASSLEKQEDLENSMQENTEKDRMAYLLDSGDEFESILAYEGYSVFNVKKINEKQYEAYLVFSLVSDLDSTTRSLIISVKVSYEDAWVVEEVGERKVSPYDLRNSFYPETVMQAVKQYEAVGETGHIKISIRTLHRVNNQVENEVSFFGTTAMDKSLKLNAEFSAVRIYNTLEYAFNPDSEGNLPKSTCAVRWMELDSAEDDRDFQESLAAEGSGSSTDGEYWLSSSLDGGRENIVLSNGWTEFPYEEFEEDYAELYKARVYWDEEMKEDVILTESESSKNIEERWFGADVNQRAVYMNADRKNIFMKEQNQVFAEKKENEEVHNLTLDELSTLIEEAMFEGEYDEELTEKLEGCGIYQFETMYSLIPTIQNWEIEILKPQIYYNANDGSWIVACGGYNNDNDWQNQIISGDVGGREHFGVRFSNVSGSYDTWVKDVKSYIVDATDNQRIENYNRADGDGSKGFSFELQDYTYMDGFDKNYVGYRWFGLCIYGEGFQNYDADVTVFYEQGKE